MTPLDEDEQGDVEPCGDCEPYVMLCYRELSDLAQRHGLTADDRWALVVLAWLVDYRTGELAETTREEIAEHLGWHRDKARTVIARLTKCDLVASHFPRGHRGWIALLAYLEIIRVKGETRSRGIAANLSRRRAEVVDSAGSPGVHNAEMLRSGNDENATEPSPAPPDPPLVKREIRGANRGPQVGDSVERPGETGERAVSDCTPAPSASEVVGGVGAAEESSAARDEGQGEGFADALRARLSPPESLPIASSPPALLPTVPEIVPVPLPLGLRDLPLTEMGWCRGCGRATATTTDDGPMCRQCHAAGAHLEVSA